MLLTLASPPAPADEDICPAPQEPAPLQMLYDADAEELEALEPEPLILAQTKKEPNS